MLGASGGVFALHWLGLLAPVVLTGAALAAVWAALTLTFRVPSVRGRLRQTLNRTQGRLKEP